MREGKAGKTACKMRKRREEGARRITSVRRKHLTVRELA